MMPKHTRSFQVNEADELRRLVAVRTGLSGADLQCPREQSAMTPCIARDGRLAEVLHNSKGAICVGCEMLTAVLLKAEQEQTP